MDTPNPTVHFSTVAHARDNTIVNWYELAWSQLRDLLNEQGHVYTEDKNIAMISPWHYKTTDEPFDPAIGTDRFGRAYTKLVDDKPVVGRLASNVKGTSILFFDYDGDLTINHAKSIFAQYTHLGYTSYSHRTEQKDRRDCFRIVLPLAQYVTPQQLSERRHAIYGAFAGLDQSCLSLARSFYVPSIAPNRRELAQMWDNDGELFDVLEYQPNIYVPPLRTPVVDRPVDRARIIDALKQIYLGNEPEWFKVACAMYAADFSYDDFVDVTVGHLMSEKTERHCRDKWKSAERATKRGHAAGVGYLINLCKRHNVWTPAASSRQAMKDIVRSAA